MLGALSPYLGIISLALSIITGLFVLAGRTWITEKIRARIQSEYAGALETLKVQLKASADVELEKFKSQATVEVEKLRSQLSSAAAERHVRFSKLHEKRAEVISEVYSRLVEVNSTVKDYVGVHGLAAAWMPSLKERHDAANKALYGLENYFAPRRIFVPKGVADKIDHIHSKYSEVSWAFFFDVQAGSDSVDLGKENEQRNAANVIADLSKTAAFDLEQEFRSLLGDERHCE